MKEKNTPLLGDELMDIYYYSDIKYKDKMDYYQKHIFTSDEQEKATSLQQRIIQFEEIVRGTKHINELINHPYYPEWNIVYFEDLGYISFVNADRDRVDVYYYGKTEDEAFINAMVSYELVVCEEYEFDNRERLNKEFSDRFLDGKVKENDYHGPFFFSELALQDFRKFYGDNLPKEIIQHYENHVNTIYPEKYKYDKEKNKFLLNKQNKKIKTF